MKKTFKILGITLAALHICVSFISCESNSKGNNQNEKRDMIYIINHSDDNGKYGEGTYINMNTEYTDRDGIRWSKDNIFAPGPGESLSDEKFQRYCKYARCGGRLSAKWIIFAESPSIVDGAFQHNGQALWVAAYNLAPCVVRGARNNKKVINF